MSAINEALPDQRLAYKHQREAGENLEIPPDLVGSSFDDALDVPGVVGGTTTYSEYSGSRAARSRIAASGSTEVLPEVSNVDLERRGDERWLEVEGSPQQVWSRVVAFWREQGILLLEQDPTVGVMRTDWLDNRAEIRKDFVTRMLSKVVEGVYATSTRDQYRVRIERGIKAGTTDIHLSHRGMEEKLVTNTLGDSERTVWEPSGRDADKEAEMLRRLMVYLGASQQRAATALAARGGVAEQPRARLLDRDGVQVLAIDEEFRRAWRLTGSALDRAGFAVEDRDQSNGLYYVRYAGATGEGRGLADEQPGMFSRLAFWRDKDKDGVGVQRYQIQVEGDTQTSRVRVLDDKGRIDDSTSAERILALLQAEIR
ncbi:outer membrane protein assembly factor BamC [Marichromatium bheemlicum]|nr:outer membrane protein assembly factor BamC [Marichromatium bheemlicum]